MDQIVLPHDSLACAQVARVLQFSSLSIMERRKEKDEVYSCEIKVRENPQRQKEKVYIGCGAGFRGDRPLAALKLLQRVKELDYLVLECLAERTLADHYQVMMKGGKGFDPQISDWMSLLLPLAVERGVCLITNMGAMDPHGAQVAVLDVASSLGLDITVSVAYEVALTKSGSTSSHERSIRREGGVSTYLGAAPLVQCLERHKPHVIVTSRVADAALFLGPMVYELGWNWNDFNQLAQGALAGHLLECGCQLTGGYFAHPGDKYRNLSFQQLLDLSLPYAEVDFNGNICIAKVEGSGGILNFSTCAEQLLYEIGDPGAYITPDVIIDIRDVSFCSVSSDKVTCTGAKPSNQCFPEKLLQLLPKECGWKGWGEISYGGNECVKRAEAAEFLVRSWMEEAFPGVTDRIMSYIIGLDSLKATNTSDNNSSMRHNEDIRLRMDGLFELEKHACHFVAEFTALYTNGPAGGGGISTGYKKEMLLHKELVRRECIFWRTETQQTKTSNSCNQITPSMDVGRSSITHKSFFPQAIMENDLTQLRQPGPSSGKVLLYQVAHSRAGDKGNDLNFSIIPHFPQDIKRLKVVITPAWVKGVVSSLLDLSSFPNPDAITKRNSWVDDHVTVEVYEVEGIHSLNVVVRNILDGGVNCSRRIDRHGKCMSDLILCQQVVLPP
ncbi:uncharacterized protein LOC131230233 isoform X2 [Magnolia sinica]|uniref:uncharacterized protein LOC131230233 isoform X2 n=1 Tax=Magnolia sinica TaxID=86752 RepID=UPI002658C61A|nr:uncharacterized protein LOC131230233 isoform X2 [Magnolia sinica]